MKRSYLYDSDLFYSTGDRIVKIGDKKIESSDQDIAVSAIKSSGNTIQFVVQSLQTKKVLENIICKRISEKFHKKKILRDLFCKNVLFETFPKNVKKIRYFIFTYND